MENGTGAPPPFQKVYQGIHIHPDFAIALLLALVKDQLEADQYYDYYREAYGAVLGNLYPVIPTYPITWPASTFVPSAMPEAKGWP